MNSDVDPELRRFMLAHVRTYEQLETLLLLSRQADRHWSAADLASALKIPGDVAQETLRALATDLIVEAAGASPEAYRLSSGPACDSVRTLERVYADNPLLVMRLMNENAIERMRTDALHAFSSAFVIRRKKKDG
jgi:hypothetical protein